MKKLLALLFTFFLSVNLCLAKAPDIDKIIENSKVAKNSTISISVKNVSDSRIIYEKNSHKLLHPASCLKLLTIMPCIKYLGQDYRFKTLIYKDSSNNVYVKLGANPYLTSQQLKSLVNLLKQSGVSSIPNLYIDADIIDSIEWGVGWMWDDDTNRLAPKYSAYNLDRNLMKIKVSPTEKGKPVKFNVLNSSNEVITNYARTGDENNIGVARFTWNSPNMLYLYGTLNKETVIEVPINNPKNYFLSELKKHLDNADIDYDRNNIQAKKVPEKDITLVAQITTPLDSAVKDILLYSNNMMIETIFKLAAGQYSKAQGSTAEAIDMFDEYYKEIVKDKKSYQVVDASGFSRNNLITTDFITDALIFNKSKEDFEYIKSKMATPTKGTLAKRLPDLKDNVYAKTGSLTGISGLSGYITTQNGENYVFSILIQNFLDDINDVKAFEDEIVQLIYNNL